MGEKRILLCIPKAAAAAAAAAFKDLSALFNVARISHLP